MNCKNCQKEISEDANYCKFCGAEVVRSRISGKEILGQVFAVFSGWDNSFFRTIRTMFRRPEVLIKEFLDGTRKKYFKPFAFLAFCTSISLIVMNSLATKYLEQYTFSSQNQVKAGISSLNNSSEEKLDPTKEVSPEEEAKAKYLQELIVKYFMMISFLLLPIYGLISWGVFGKPFNFGEHLTINAFIQGFIALVSTSFFLISLISSDVFYILTFGFTIVYYLFAYGRLYQYNFLRVVLSFFKFIGIVSLGAFLIWGIGYLLGFLF
ncbi:MAG: DUF3667 domain-containing protein [Bacteroidia bacterium]|nr:DUF3667 domain-containing protein [Bacteroidia bacterium]